MLCAAGQGDLLRTGARGGLRVPVAAASGASTDAAAVWDEFHQSLLAFIARRVRDRDTAEDLLQDVMLRIHRHAGELEHVSAVGAWVHQITRNAITDHYRRAVQRHERPVGIEMRGDDVEPVHMHDTARSEIAACLRPLLEELPPAHREALSLTELGGLSQAEAARQLGVSGSGMKSRVQRGRAQLRDLLVACCEIDLDRRAHVIGYEPRGGACACRARSPMGERRAQP
jgi:RNA polymerase sigma-70 factor (ECF subfamily)